MLYPISTCVLPGAPSGQLYKHIVYVGEDGHIHDLVASLKPVPGGFAPEGVWKYNLDITAAANATVKATNAIQPNYLSPVPNAVGHVWAMSTLVGSIYVFQIVYWGADEQIHVLFPVGYGYFFRGEPGIPGDPGDFLDGGDDDDDPANSPPLGFDYDLGEPNAQASPAGWVDQLITDPSATGSYVSGPPVAGYVDPDGSAATVYFGSNGYLYAVRGAVDDWGGTSTGAPINITELAGNPPVGWDGSAVPLFHNGSDNVFSIDQQGGGLYELSSTDIAATWSAQEVQQKVTKATGSAAQSPLAPPALASSVPAAFSSSGLNVAYITAKGSGVNLCSQPNQGDWSIAYISETAQAPPAGSGSAPISGASNLLAYASDRDHVLLTTPSGQIVDLWYDGKTWHWGLPIRIAGNPLGAGQLANVATGLSTFVTTDKVDHIVYIGGGPISPHLGPFIWELQYEQSQPAVPDNPNNPNFGQKGLPWVAVNATMQAAGPVNVNSWSNAKYVPPIAKAQWT